MLTTEDPVIATQQALITPDKLIGSLPIPGMLQNKIASFRKQIEHIIQGTDQRRLVIVGPCSIHDTDAAYEYALKLNELAIQLKDDLLIIMRVYFEKPRTTFGWKGFIRDPHLDQTYDINQGLTRARQLLLAINELGLPTATEFVDVMIPHYLQDLISWSAIGARTVQSQMHRELASGLTMPVGFKNNTDGNIKVAIDAVQTASHPHHFLGINKSGQAHIIQTKGNPNCHIILRGSSALPNFRLDSMQNTTRQLTQAGLMPRLMVDCSHGNSMKDYQKQHDVLDYLITHLERFAPALLGIMLESNLVAGKQKLTTNHSLIYGQSITDGCIGWDETESSLIKWASFIKKRL